MTVDKNDRKWRIRVVEARSRGVQRFWLSGHYALRKGSDHWWTQELETKRFLSVMAIPWRRGSTLSLIDELAVKVSPMCSQPWAQVLFTYVSHHTLSCTKAEVCTKTTSLFFKVGAWSAYISPSSDPTISGTLL